MTKNEFAEGVAFLAACLDRDIPAATVEAWFLVLGELDAGRFKRAVVEVIRNHRYSGLPPIGQILHAAGLATGIADADSAAIAAWDKVLRAIRSIGGWRSPRWDDPAIPAAIESAAGSWTQLCDCPSGELHSFKRPQFLKAYVGARVMRINGPTVSAGILAQDAGRRGFDAPEPVGLGDEIKRVEGFGGEQPKALPGPVQKAADLIGRLSNRVEDEPVSVTERPCRPAPDPELERAQRIRDLDERFPDAATTKPGTA